MIPDKLRALSINTKLTLLIFCLLCLPFLLFGVLWYAEATRTIQDNAVQSNKQLAERLSDQLDSYIADINNVTFPLISHPYVKRFMKTDPLDRYGMFEVTRDIEREVLPNIRNSRPDIYGFSIITKFGAVTSYGNFNAQDRNVDYLSQADDGSTIKIVGINKMPDTNLNAITVLHYFHDVETYQTLGLLAIDLKLNKISAMLSQIKLGETGFVWLMDANGRRIYYPDWDKIGEPADPFYIEAANETPIYRELDGTNKLIYKRKSELTGWTLVSEVPIRELNGRLTRLRNTTIWVVSALILFVLIVIGIFSFNLTRSVSLLQRLMKRAESGDLTVRAPEKRRDEIGGLNKSFNKMVGEIRRLIEFVHKAELREKEMEIKQRESSLQAMQSQINPHFLYNTLEVINSYAIIEGVMPISHMATSLADIFRYSVGDARQIVTLEEEMKHISTYFAIQKERYRYLTVDISVPDTEAVRVQAVRLMLQPLVENTFIHAYEKHKLRPEYVGIEGIPKPDHYLVRVTDRGRGMDPFQMEQYNRLFAGFGTEMETEEPKAGGSRRIGLLNVHQRLRLTFGEPYGLFIRRGESGGTIIEIKLPYEAG